MSLTAEEIFSKYAFPKIPSDNPILKKYTCCGAPLETVDGFMLCVTCGKVQQHFCDVNLASFSQSFYPCAPIYSRKTRFEKKLLAALTCKSFYVVNNALVEFLKEQQIKTPEDC